jgi:catechol 2,3-dioxygenase-like lactoylglutathione lyase family enzyme
MIEAIDHIVIPVRDLDAAVADYSALGFTVVAGGRHAGLNTHNALIAFADGCYFELIAFLGEPSQRVHWWYEALQRGGGLTDFCVLSDQLEDDAAIFQRAGVEYSPPFAMSRERPDGYRLNWELAVNESSSSRGVVPFFIRDATPRDERVPRERIHRNGAAGVETLAIVVADLDSTQSMFEKTLGRKGERIERDDLRGEGVHFPLGRHQLQLIRPCDTSGVAAQRLRIRGPCPVEVKLVGNESRVVLDIIRSHGARIALG